MGVLILRKLCPLSVEQGNWSPQNPKWDIAYPVQAAENTKPTEERGYLHVREGHPGLNSLFQTVA